MPIRQISGIPGLPTCKPRNGAWWVFLMVLLSPQSPIFRRWIRFLLCKPRQIRNARYHLWFEVFKVYHSYFRSWSISFGTRNQSSTAVTSPSKMERIREERRNNTKPSRTMGRRRMASRHCLPWVQRDSKIYITKIYLFSPVFDKYSPKLNIVFTYLPYTVTYGR